MIAPLPIRAADCGRPAIAIIFVSAIIGTWSMTPDRVASAKALDEAAWNYARSAWPAVDHGSIVRDRTPGATAAASEISAVGSNEGTASLKLPKTPVTATT